MRIKTPLLSLLFLLSGCVVWDHGYTENRPVTEYRVAADDRFPVTYSIAMIYERGDIVGVPDEKSLREKIDDALRATGLFSEISYGVKGGQDSYHIEFNFHQAGASMEDSMAVGLLCGYTLLLVPGMEILTFDGSATLSIQGRDIYSVAKAEEIRCLVWLPMAPVGLFMNPWSVWHFLERGSVNALCESIAQEHKRRFLKDADISVVERK